MHDLTLEKSTFLIDLIQSKGLLSLLGQMFQFTEHVWSLHLSENSSCWITMPGWIKQSEQLLQNKWMVWKEACFLYKGWTVFNTQGHSHNDQSTTCRAGLPNSLARKPSARAKLDVEKRPHYNIHLRDSRAITRNYILFMEDYIDSKRKDLALTL